MEQFKQGKEALVELLDIYDEKNQPTGQFAPRETVHAEGLWHRTVHIYVVRNTERGLELLVHLRSKLKKQYALRLDPVFGGHIKSGHNEQETALSEFAEETGIHPDAQRLNYEGCAKKDDPVNAPNDREFNMIFMYALSPEEEQAMKFDPEEVDSTKWLTLQQVRDDIEANPQAWRPSREELENGLSVLSKTLK